MKKNGKNINRFQQTKDYYPLINPDQVDDDTHVSVPNETDIKKAKRWVDKTQK